LAYGYSAIASNVILPNLWDIEGLGKQSALKIKNNAIYPPNGGFFLWNNVLNSDISTHLIPQVICCEFFVPHIMAGEKEEHRMSQLKNTMEIFKLLDKSNCRECNEATCLAFAAAVFKGQKQLDACPHLSSEIIERYDGKAAAHMTFEQEREQAVEQLKREIAFIDFSLSAEKLGASFSDDKLTIKCLGKDFSVDTKGKITTDIHVHLWITIPVLNYITNSAGVSASGKWVPFRELEGGKTWYRLFEQRCEKPLKKVADTYTDLFEDMIHLFNGRQVENHYHSDISLVLHPLPKVPILICYWKPEESLESNLNIFFDSTAEENLNIESIYTLGVGLVRMFEKLALRHGLQ